MPSIIRQSQIAHEAPVLCTDIGPVRTVFSKKIMIYDAITNQPMITSQNEVKLSDMFYKLRSPHLNVPVYPIS